MFARRSFVNTAAVMLAAADDAGASATTARSQRTKLTLKDLGEPSTVKTLAVDVKSYTLGMLVGVARDFIQRTDDKTGNVLEGLKGEFRSIPSDEEKGKGREELESGVLWMPDAFHTMIASTLLDARKADPAAEVQFAFEVKSIRADNPAGYSWDFRPLMQAKPDNRLDALVQVAQTNKVLPSAGAAKALEAPKDDDGGKGKGKK